MIFSKIGLLLKVIYNMRLIKNNSNYTLTNVGIFVRNKTKKVKPLEGVEFFPLDIIESGEIYLNKRKKVDNNIKSDLILVEHNNILYGKCRPLLDKAIVAPDNGVTTGEVLVYETEFVNFFIHLFHNKNFLNYNVSNSSGSKMPRTSNEIVKSFNFKFISNEHMLKTGNILHKNYLRLDALKKLIKKLEIRNQYYADKLLNGEISIENNKISNTVFSSKSLTMDSIVNDLPKSKLDAKVGSNKGDYRFFKSSAEVYWSGDFIYDTEAIIMADGGKANIEYYNGKFSTSNHVYVFNSPLLNNKYFYYLLKSNMHLIDNCFQGAALKNLSKKQFKKLELNIFEDSNYQNEIVKFLDNLYDEKEKIVKLLELEKQRFEWLSDKLLSGEYIIED